MKRRVAKKILRRWVRGFGYPARSWSEAWWKHRKRVLRGDRPWVRAYVNKGGVRTEIPFEVLEIKGRKNP